VARAVPSATSASCPAAATKRVTGTSASKSPPTPSSPARPMLGGGSPRSRPTCSGASGSIPTPARSRSASTRLGGSPSGRCVRGRVRSTRVSSATSLLSSRRCICATSIRSTCGRGMAAWHLWDAKCSAAAAGGVARSRPAPAAVGGAVGHRRHRGAWSAFGRCSNERRELYRGSAGRSRHRAAVEESQNVRGAAGWRHDGVVDRHRRAVAHVTCTPMPRTPPPLAGLDRQTTESAHGVSTGCWSIVRFASHTSTVPLGTARRKQHRCATTADRTKRRRRARRWGAQNRQGGSRPTVT
jgi:hypothetical protein